MKKFNLNKIVVLLVSLVVLTACVEDDKFDLPNPDTFGISTYPNVDAEFNSVSAVLGNWGSNNDQPYTYDEAGNGVTEKYTAGYVVSSDEGGNFYKELVIQDKPINPTAAIAIQVDKNPLFTQYEFGRRVFIKLNGLTVAEDNGVIQLGRLSGEDLDRISTTQVNETIIRTDEIATIEAKEVSISDFSDDLESQYIRLNNMYFEESLAGMTFASEPTDSFDGERLMENCVGGSVILSTSTFSDFKGLTLPTGRGTIDGILTRDFFDDDFVIYVNSPEAINFYIPEPCPEPLLEATFDEATDNTTFNFDGWLNIAEAGGEFWTEQVYQGNGYAEFSAFSTGDSSNIGWLISPAMDFDMEDGEVLSFQTEHAYPDSGHDAIKVYISTDFDGTQTGVGNATWEELDFTSSLENDFSDWFTWTDSGEIDLSSYTGTGYIAFVYTGSDTSNMNTTIHVDNVFVVVQ